MTDETGGDPVRTFTLEEKGRLTAQLEAIVRRVHAGEFRERPLTLSLLCDFHYDLRAIELAVTTHADIIRVHPFEDGNGRSSRLCASHLLVALGLYPVAIEAVKQEYTETLNHYFVTKDRGPLVDLFVRLYPVGR